MSRKRQAGILLLAFGALASFFGMIGLMIGAVMMIVGGAIFARSFLEG